MWGDDANDRVIPVIPAPRSPLDLPICCRTPMRRDGDHWTCGRCAARYGADGERPPMPDDPNRTGDASRAKRKPRE